MASAAFAAFAFRSFTGFIVQVAGEVPESSTKKSTSK